MTTFLRSDAELAKIAEHRAFPVAGGGGGRRTSFTSLSEDEADAAASRPLVSHAGAVDAFKIHGREIYWLCRTRFSDSEFSGSKLEKMLGMRMTVRNSTTVRKLAARCEADAG